jgi:hypothetical protein
MFEVLSEQHALTIVDRLIQTLLGSPLRAPSAGEGEEHYVASVLVSVVRQHLVELQGLTLHGEGLQRPAPARYLGYSMYPDLAVMNYSQRVVAVEVKYVNFANARGDLSTAIGQTVIYARAGYLTALAVLIGVHATGTQSEVEAENSRLRKDGALWRLCSPRLI